MNETTKLRWFEEIAMKCDRCGGRASGILRGSQNESYGKHCKRCAEKRLRDSEKARAKST
jgi:hypothetical protein